MTIVMSDKSGDISHSTHRQPLLDFHGVVWLHSFRCFNSNQYRQAEKVSYREETGL